MTTAEAGKEGLRQRNVPVQATSEEEARETVLELNALEDKKDVRDDAKKTFGRTPDGTGKDFSNGEWNRLREKAGSQNIGVTNSRDSLHCSPDS